MSTATTLPLSRLISTELGRLMVSYVADASEADSLLSINGEEEQSQEMGYSVEAPTQASVPANQANQAMSNSFQDPDSIETFNVESELETHGRGTTGGSLQGTPASLTKPPAVFSAADSRTIAVNSFWTPLARQLNIPVEQLSQLWNSLSEQDQKGFWAEVLKLRVRTTQGHQGFQKLTAQRIQGKALAKLEDLLDKGQVKSVGELIALARLTERSGHSTPPGGGITFNFGAGDTTVQMRDGERLPGGDGVIKIDLSPRMAAQLQKPQAKPAPSQASSNGMVEAEDAEIVHPSGPTPGSESGGDEIDRLIHRVIDSEMIKVEELRRLRRSEDGSVTIDPLPVSEQKP